MKKYKHTLLLIVGVAMSLLAVHVWVNAAATPRPVQTFNVPAVMNYQGMLGDSQGDPLTGNYAMTFKVYATAQGGAALWEETQAVTVTNGLFNVYLGDVVALSESLFDGQNLYLGVTVGTDEEMAPRLRMASVPYAFGAQQNLCTRVTWYYDEDGDGYGDPAIPYEACEAPPNYVDNNTDCDDTNPDLNPETLWYQDADNDGYGNPAVSQMVCEAPAGYVLNNGDCNDGNPALNPETLWYADNDSDTYGDPNTFQQVCEQPSGYVANSSDCNDADPNVNPDGAEICDGIDNDCDGNTDEIEDLTPPLCDMQEGVCSGAVKTCGGSQGWVPCTAAEYGTNYEEDEVSCDGLDNDCDGITDEGCQ